MSARVLMTTYGGGHVTMLLPVARVLRERGAEVTFVALTLARQAVEAKGFPAIGFRELADPESDHAALRVGEELAGELPPSVVSRSESVAYLGLSFAELVADIGEPAARRAYRERGRQAFLPVAVMERAIRRLQPDLVFATNSPRAERAAIMAAARQGVPAICVVDLFAAAEVAWIGQPGFADRVCVLSEFVRQRLLAAGRKPEEVVVTGNPVFDRYADPALAARGAEFRRRWSGGKVILYASQLEPDLHPIYATPGNVGLPQRLEAALAQTARRRPDWDIVVRPHPSEQRGRDSVADVLGFSGPQDDLAVVLAAVDAVVTMTSTVGLEAALLGKPVVAVNGSVITEDAPYSAMGIARGVDHVEEIEDALRDVLSGTWRPAASLPPPGEATDKVVAVAEQLQRERRSRPRDDRCDER